jgi:hypothetical protein
VASEENAFCISCGEEISSNENFCPECGASQDPEELNDGNAEADDHTGFTSWAIGFKPGSTLRNILVGFVYVLFTGLSVAVLIYAYLKEHPEKLSTAAWISGIFFILAGAGAFADGSGRGIIAGVISIIIGVLYLPAVRERLPIGSPPGIDEVNTGRRNALVSTGYWFGGAMIVGGIAPETETETTGSTGTTSGDSSGSNDGSEDTSGGTSEGSNDGSEDTSGGTSEGSNEEAYPNAYYYDEGTGIVLEDDVSAEANSIGALYIRGTARNESGQSYSYVQITFSVLDSSGAKVADALANTNELSDGQAWRYEALAASAENADSYQIQDINAY